MKGFGRWRPAVPLLWALALLATPLSARAEFVMTLVEGSNSMQIVDGDSNDKNTNPGAITFIGSFGDFNIDVNGTSFRQDPTQPGPKLQITPVAITNTGSAPGTQSTLTILLSDQGFTSPGGPGSLMTLRSSVGGSYLFPPNGAPANDSWSFTSYADPDNTLGNSLVALTFMRIQTPPVSGTINSEQGSFSGDSSSPSFKTDFFSLTDSMSFTRTSGDDPLAFNPSGTTSVTAAAAVVPEPASLALGAAGILLVGLHGWRVRKKRA